MSNSCPIGPSVDIGPRGASRPVLIFAPTRQAGVAPETAGWAVPDTDRPTAARVPNDL